MARHKHTKERSTTNQTEPGEPTGVANQVDEALSLRCPSEIQVIVSYLVQMRSSVQNRRTNQKGQNEICTPLCEGDNHLFDAQVGEQIQRTYLYIFVACVVCDVILVLFLVHCLC